MSEWESPRAKAERKRRESYDGFESLGQLVDKGEMTWEQVFAIERNLGAVGLVSTTSEDPLVQASAIKRLERSIDEAQGVRDE